MSDSDLIELAVKKIANACQPVSFSGAGLSAESGIATFRDRADEGALWSKFDPQKLASQDGFRTAPETVIDWYNWRRKTLADATPNQAHRSLAGLQGWTHITQNVDNLLEVAQQSVDAATSRVLHLHGTLLEDHCNADCGYREAVDLHSPPMLRNCDCGAFMRPSVVWFGESLPDRILQTAMEKSQMADLMLVVGTSAQVYPAAGLVDLAAGNGADIIVVNTEASSVTGAQVIELVGPAGELLPKLFESD
jgi:NAD-dependent deacetylase